MLSPISYYPNSYIPRREPEQPVGLEIFEYVQGEGTADVGLPTLIEMLRAGSTLEKLILNCNYDMQEDQLSELAEVLEKNITLKVVEITISRRISDLTNGKLIKALGNIRNLEILRFKGWPKTKVQIEALVEGIIKTPALRSLELRYSPDLISHTAGKLVAALAKISTLEVLTLYCGDDSNSALISDGKIKLLIDAFKQHGKLKILKLYNGQVTLKNALALLEINTIVELVVPKIREQAFYEELLRDAHKGATVADGVIEGLENDLLDTLEKNTTLLSFSINLTFISPETRKKCEEYLNRNGELLFERYKLWGYISKESFPPELIEFIYKQMYDGYWGHYPEPSAENSELTMCVGSIKHIAY